MTDNNATETAIALNTHTHTPFIWHLLDECDKYANQIAIHLFYYVFFKCMDEVDKLAATNKWAIHTVY